jgi:ABC-type transport system involved in cytochrome c biogenesis permease subunit
LPPSSACATRLDVPTGPARLAAFVHPAVGLIAVGLLAYAASLGLRARERGGEEPRRRHARLAPWILGLVLANLVLGLGSTALLRSDLELAQGAHFALACGATGLLAAAALLSRRIPQSEQARRIHPALGLLALLAAALAVFTGLALLPL